MAGTFLITEYSRVNIHYVADDGTNMHVPQRKALQTALGHTLADPAVDKEPRRSKMVLRHVYLEATDDATPPKIYRKRAVIASTASSHWNGSATGPFAFDGLDNWKIVDRIGEKNPAA